MNSSIKDLNELLKSNIGKELLVVWNKRNATSAEYLGTIKNKAFIDGYGYVVLPMDEHVHNDNYDKRWVLSEGPIKIYHLYLKILDKDKCDPCLEGQCIYVGDEVKDYFSNYNKFEYVKAMRMLGRKPPEEWEMLYKISIQDRLKDALLALDSLICSEIEGNLIKRYAKITLNLIREFKADTIELRPGIYVNLLKYQNYLHEKYKF